MRVGGSGNKIDILSGDCLCLRAAAAPTPLASSWRRLESFISKRRVVHPINGFIVWSRTQMANQYAPEVKRSFPYT